MSNNDGCVSSHSMPPQHHMHSSLSSAAPWRTDGCMAPIFTLEDKNTETEAGCLSLLPVCKEKVCAEQEERNSSLVVQVKPEPLQIKEEQEEELLQGPKEAAGSTLTSLAVKREDDDDNVNRDTEPLASTSTEHMETQAYIEYVVPSSSLPTSDQLLSSHRSECERCTDCGKPYDHITCLKSHMRFHTGEKPFVCYECGRVFDDRSRLKEHMRSHRDACTYCGKVFLHTSQLKMHMKAHADENRYTCTECGRVCRGTGGLKLHMRTHTGSSTLRTGKQTFPCTECRQVFRLRSQLKYHLVTHAAKNPFAGCTDCGKLFGNMPQLRQHMRFHTGEKPFRCCHCYQVFDDRSLLKEHMSSHGDNVFRCCVCGTAFITVNDLKEHLVTHAGKNPISCTECGECFVKMFNLRLHMRFHTGVKPFNCNQCGLVFDDRSLLKEHVSSQRLTNRTDCGKVFMGSLKQHRRTHTGSENSTVESKGFGLKPEPLQIKEEQQEGLLHGPEEAAGSTLTSLAVQREDDDIGSNGS